LIGGGDNLMAAAARFSGGLRRAGFEKRETGTPRHEGDRAIGGKSIRGRAGQVSKRFMAIEKALGIA